MCVHSHADAPESSGAFFHDIGIGKCRKQSSRRRNALRASEGVRPTDVMVNSKSEGHSAAVLTSTLRCIFKHDFNHYCRSAALLLI